MAHYEKKERQIITPQDVDGLKFKFIPNTNDMFAVGRNGKVYSFSPKMGGKEVGAKGPNGYVIASILYVDGKRKMEYVHRLVANAFLDNPEGKNQVIHINEDKTDNRILNLMWATSKEACSTENHNVKLSKSIKDFYKNRSQFGKLPKRVVIMDSNDKILEISPSIQAAADYIKELTGKDDNSSSVQISAILQGKKGFRTCGGFKVREADEKEYTEWVVQHMNTLIEEEDINISDVQVKKLTKVGGVRMVNRRLVVSTGEMEYEIYDFKEGEKVVNELK